MAVHVVDFIKKLASRHLLLFVWLTASSLAVSCEEPEPGPVDPEDLPAEIADPVFARVLTEQFDLDGNGVLSNRELKGITVLSLNTDGIADIGEIRNMTELTSLSCKGSKPGFGRLKSLDISKNPKLTVLMCDNNWIESLDLSNNPALRQITVSGNPLGRIDITTCPGLEMLDATNCGKLKEIIITAEQSDRAEAFCKKDSQTAIVIDPDSAIPVPDPVFMRYLLNNFDTDGNGCLSVAEAEEVISIVVCTDSIQTLSGIRFFVNLKHLECAGSNDGNGGPASGQLTELDVSAARHLICLNARNNRLELLNISQQQLLDTLNVGHNALQSLDVTPNWALRTLICPHNKLTSLKGLSRLCYLDCEYNELTSLDLSGCPFLYTLYCTGNHFTVLDLSDCKGAKDIRCDNIPPFPDANFQAYMVSVYDSDGDGFLSLADASRIAALEVVTDDIASLAGLELLINLRYLRCVGTLGRGQEDGSYGKLTELNLKENDKLTDLICSYNHIRELDVSDKPFLRGLDCSHNELTILDVSQNAQLKEIDCSHNKLAALDVSHNTALHTVLCQENQLTALNIANIPELFTLNAASNRLASLDLAAHRYMISLNVSDNQFSSLDVSHNVILEHLLCSDNQLTLLDVSNNLELSELRCEGNPSLAEIWLKTGQTIANFSYDAGISTICFK